MRLNRVVAVVLAGSAVIAFLLVACNTTTQSDFIATVTQEQKYDNATATAKVLISQGIDPDTVAVVVGKGSLAEKSVATFNAGLTATAETEAGGGITPTAIQLGTGSEEEPSEAPDGPAESGEVRVLIFSSGRMDPPVVKITVGTTVIWENTERSTHSTRADEGQDEFWDSGSMHRPVLQRENTTFVRTFTIPGRYTYGSAVGGDSGRGTVFVVEE